MASPSVAVGHRTPPYSEDQSRRWLSWLARAMLQRGQIVFAVEGLQPGWLVSSWAFATYVLWSRTLCAFLIALYVASIHGFVLLINDPTRSIVRAMLILPWSAALAIPIGIVLGIFDLAALSGRSSHRRWLLAPAVLIAICLPLMCLVSSSVELIEKDGDYREEIRWEKEESELIEKLH